MSTGYQIANQTVLYYQTQQVVDWEVWWS